MSDDTPDDIPDDVSDITNMLAHSNDQVKAMYRDRAQRFATFYTELLRQGVPVAVAAQLTLNESYTESHLSQIDSLQDFNSSLAMDFPDDEDI